MQCWLCLGLFLVTLVQGQGDVLTKYGYVRGHFVTLSGGVEVVSFLGIPYAKPPTGELRYAVSLNRYV